MPTATDSTAKRWTARQAVVPRHTAVRFSILPQFLWDSFVSSVWTNAGAACRQLIEVRGWGAESCDVHGSLLPRGIGFEQRVALGTSGAGFRQDLRSEPSRRNVSRVAHNPNGSSRLRGPACGGRGVQIEVDDRGAAGQVHREGLEVGVEGVHQDDVARPRIT